ncbi:lysophospholipase [Microbacteriaceae bacterium VKM Ac-2854]|nr:lysophospholipase [Microbacteriaceae bacterium VKM Ac-2854]
MAATTVGSFDEPEGLAARGTLVLLGGRGETPAVYERFGTRISRDAYKLRVLGDATADTDAVRAAALELLADAELPSPKILVGSDAGASLALEIAATAAGNIDGVVLAGLPAGSASAADDQIEARTACPNHQKVLRREVGDSALDRTLPAELLAVAASAVTVPVLAVHGEADAISPLADASTVYTQLPHVEFFTVNAGRHDILNDVSHRSVAATVTLFLERLKVNGDMSLPIIRKAALDAPAQA